MPRQIVTKKRLRQIGVAAAPEEDKYTSKIIKLIPADIISVYLAVFSLIKSQGQNSKGNHTLQWIVFVIIAIITPFYLKSVAKIESAKQIVLCFISFCIWVFTLGGPFDGQMIGGFSPQFLGAIILPIFTLIIPLLYKED